MAFVTCPICGLENIETSRLCALCGTPLEDGVERDAAQPSQKGISHIWAMSLDGKEALATVAKAAGMRIVIQSGHYSGATYWFVPDALRAGETWEVFEEGRDETADKAALRKALTSETS